VPCWTGRSVSRSHFRIPRLWSYLTRSAVLSVTVQQPRLSGTQSTCSGPGPVRGGLRHHRHIPGVVMIIGSHNVDNLFSRPKAMNVPDDIGAPLPAAQAELQTLLELTTYTEPVKTRILELLRILGLEWSDSTGFAVLRKIRGQQLRRPKNGAGRGRRRRSGRLDRLGRTGQGRHRRPGHAAPAHKARHRLRGVRRRRTCPTPGGSRLRRHRGCRRAGR